MVLNILAVYLVPSSFLLAEQNNLSPWQVLKGAYNLIRLHFWRTVWFQLSFTIWFSIELAIILILSRLLKTLPDNTLSAIIIRLCQNSALYFSIGIYLTPYWQLANIFYCRDLRRFDQEQSVLLSTECSESENI